MPHSIPFLYETMKIRVLHIVKNLTVGGVERIVIDICNGLDRSRFEPHIVALSDDDLALRDRLLPDVGFEAFHTNYSPLPDPRQLHKQYRLLCAHIAHLKPDIVHVNCYGTRLYMTACATRKAAPEAAFVKTEHGLPSIYRSKKLKDRLSRRLEKHTYRTHAIHLTAVGKSVAANNERLFGSLAASKHLILNSVDGQLFDRSRYRFTKADFDYDERDCLVVHVGRLDPIKNHSYLLTAWRHLQEMLDASPYRARLVLMGDGPERTRIERSIHQLTITTSVRLAGNVVNVPEWLSVADIAVLPSLSEGMPLVLAEQMMMRLPVVGSDIPSIRDLIDEGVTGFCAPLDHPEQFAQRLYELVVDPARREQMGLAAERFARQEFSRERMMQQYEALYEAIVKR